MTKHKNYIILKVAVLTIILFLVGCGSSQPPVSIKSIQDKVETINETIQEMDMKNTIWQKKIEAQLARIEEKLR